MAPLSPPLVKPFPDNSIERKVYNIVEALSKYLPIPNDRNRLGFVLVRYMKGEGDAPLISIKSAKLKLKGISEVDFARIVTDELTFIE
jgi:hypothetical protein